MFKIGDKVKCITKPPRGHFQLSHAEKCVGEIYTVSLVKSPEIIQLKNEYGNFNPNNFKLFKDNLSEIDYLDAFQLNFKEGV